MPVLLNDAMFQQGYPWAGTLYRFKGGTIHHSQGKKPPRLAQKLLNFLIAGGRHTYNLLDLSLLDENV